MSLSNSKFEERSKRMTEELEESTLRAEEAERRTNSLESRGRQDYDKIESLEEKLKVCKFPVYFGFQNIYFSVSYLFLHDVILLAQTVTF